MPGFGRIESIDVRDAKYRFGLVIPQEYPTRIKRKKYTIGMILDQGQNGTCVGHGWASWLSCTPVQSWGDPIAIYNRATELDEWPGNEHDLRSGTSVRAGVKVLEELGRVHSYVWANDSHDVANWILRRGPVVIGIPWYQGMMVLSNDGYVVLGGSQVGGHCVLVYGCDLTTRTLFLQNSWGSGWGELGRFKMTFDVLDSLLSDHGECCAAVERKLLV